MKISFIKKLVPYKYIRHLRILFTIRIYSTSLVSHFKVQGTELNSWQIIKLRITTLLARLNLPQEASKWQPSTLN